MPILFNTDQVGAQEFFKRLSDPTFLNNYRVTITPQKGSAKIEVTAKRAIYNPIKWIGNLFGPESPEEKLRLAKNLTALINQEAANIVSDPLCKTEEVLKNLDKLALKLPRNTDPVTEKKPILDALQSGRATLKSASTRYWFNFFSRNKPQWIKGPALNADQFYRDLSSNRWFWNSPFSPFNSRVHITQPQAGHFEIYTSSKPWFFSKIFAYPTESKWLIRNWFAKPVSGAEKVATVQNLTEMLKAHAPFIRQNRYKVQGMINALKAMKDSLVRNTSDGEKNAITSQLNQAIALLVGLKAEIAKDQDHDLSRRMGRIVRDWMVIPAWKKVVRPSLQVAWRMGAYPVKAISERTFSQ